MLNNDECQFIVNALDAFTKQTGLEHAAKSLNIISKLQQLSQVAAANEAAAAEAAANEASNKESSDEAAVKKAANAGK